MIAYLLIALFIAEEEDDWRWIVVKYFGNMEVLYKVLATDTIYEAKSLIALELDIAEEDFCLVYKGKRLQEEDDKITMGLFTHLTRDIKIHVSMDMTGGGDYTEHNRGGNTYIYIYVYIYMQCISKYINKKRSVFVSAKNV